MEVRCAKNVIFNTSNRSKATRPAATPLRSFLSPPSSSHNLSDFLFQKWQHLSLHRFAGISNHRCLLRSSSPNATTSMMAAYNTKLYCFNSPIMFLLVYNRITDDLLLLIFFFLFINPQEAIRPSFLSYCLQLLHRWRIVASFLYSGMKPKSEKHLFLFFLLQLATPAIVFLCTLSPETESRSLNDPELSPCYRSSPSICSPPQDLMIQAHFLWFSVENRPRPRTSSFRSVASLFIFDEKRKKAEMGLFHQNRWAT